MNPGVPRLALRFPRRRCSLNNLRNFFLLNYAFGLTRVKWSHYVVASWLGMIPGTVMYVYLGSLINVGAGRRQRTTGEWVLYGVGLLATVIVTVFVTRLARKALAKKVGSNEIAQNPKR